MRWSGMTEWHPDKLSRRLPHLAVRARLQAAMRQWFAGEGFPALGCDYSRAGVAYAKSRARESELSAEFVMLNLYDLRHVLARSAWFAHERRTEVVYARFLVHALEDVGRQNLWIIGRGALKGTHGCLYLEFRTEPTAHEFGEHYRRFVQPDVVVGELEGHGFEVEHLDHSYGLAAYNNEDPRICRIVARVRR